MAPAKLISTRLTVCPICGHEARLVASTSDEIVSRCYACGDVTHRPCDAGTAWSAATALRGNRQTRPPAEPQPREHRETLAG